LADDQPTDGAGLFDSLRRVLTASIDDSGLGPVRGALGTAVTAILGVLVPIVILVSSDDLFIESGFGLLAGMTATLGYSAYVLIRSLRRGDARTQLESADSIDRAEATQTFFVDLLGAAVLGFMLLWLMPARPLLLEAGQDLLAWALTAGMGVVGLAGLASLREGVLRAMDFSSALDELDVGEQRAALGAPMDAMNVKRPRSPEP